MTNQPKVPGGGESAIHTSDVDKLVEAWVSSKEGTEQLLAARDSARSAADKVISDAEVQPEQLRQAVTL